MKAGQALGAGTNFGSCDDIVKEVRNPDATVREVRIPTYPAAPSSVVQELRLPDTPK